MPRRLAIAVAAFVVIAFGAGHWVRTGLGLEVSAAGLQQAVSAMGWRAPALFLGLVTFRQFLFLPAIVLLPVGGICFGAALGTLLGASGIVLSALMTFGLARGLGWQPTLLLARHAWIASGIDRLGPAIVGFGTAHPTGPMSALFWGAGFSSMALLPFTVAVVLGGSVRALAYSFLGSTLPAAGTPRFYVACATIALATVAPLAHPGVRRRLAGLRARARARRSADASSR
ncbi:MAG TPA: VTT domain-containing protein [Candidatus Binatia bacterium]|nr:VTT domain-containing protein [Candidatus Binatia bacterium]